MVDPHHKQEMKWVVHVDKTQHERERENLHENS